MENKISERNVVLGLTIFSIGLLAGMIIMPSVAVQQSDLTHALITSDYAWTIWNGGEVSTSSALFTAAGIFLGLIICPPTGISGVVAYL